MTKISIQNNSTDSYKVWKAPKGKIFKIRLSSQPGYKEEAQKFERDRKYLEKNI